MTVSIATRALDSELVARELGNWRTSSRSGPTYQGLADGLRMLIVDGRLPVGSRLPSERALADALRARGEKVDGYPSRKLVPTRTTAVTPAP